MISAWFKGVKTDEDKAKRESMVRGSKATLDLLTELMNDDEKSLNKASVSSKAYENANWALKQADTIGYIRCLNNYRTLINLDQKDLNS